MLSKLLIFSVQFYQKFISPLKPKRVQCRFYPTCSRYASISINIYGAIRGTNKSINRLSRCRRNNTERCIDYRKMLKTKKEDVTFINKKTNLLLHKSLLNGISLFTLFRYRTSYLFEVVVNYKIMNIKK